MKRLLLPSTAFVRSARRFTRKHPQLAPELRLPLEFMIKIFGLVVVACIVFSGVVHAQTNALSVKLDKQTLTLLEKSTEGNWAETLVSAFVGGAMAILAAWYAFRQQANKEKDDGKKFNLQVVKAICCEVKTLQGVYDEGTGKFLRACLKNEIKPFPVESA